MSNTISGGISFGGIGSGMDMNAIVDQLKKVQEIPVNRLNLTKAENEYRIQALEAVLQQMRDSNSILKKFNTPSKLLNLNIESSTSSVASATVLGNAELTEGSYKIDVKQIAKASIYTSNNTFDKKDSIINNSGTTKKFGYTYKGVTRELEVPNGTTLEQFVKRINNDAQNPGVKASLVKSGSGYMLQIQGKDTGKDAELIISSDLDSFKSSEKLFTGSDIVINNSVNPSTMKYSYKGKEYSFEVKANMTAKDFVDEFNKDTNQAVKAKLTRVGSDYKIEFTEKGNNTPVNLKISSDIPVLGGKNFTNANDIANTTGQAQELSYNYKGKKYSVTVNPNETVQQVIDKINAKSTGQKPDHPGLTARFDTSTNQIVFDHQEVFIESSNGKNIEVKLNDGKKDYKFTVADGLNVESYVEQFNKYAKDNKLDIKAELDNTTKKIKYTNKDGTSTSSVKITATNDKNNIIDGTGTYTEKTVTDISGFTSDMDGFGKKQVLSGKDTLVNNSGNAETFTVEFEGGKQVSFNVPQGTTLEKFVELFNQNTNSTGIEAKLVQGASGYKVEYIDKNNQDAVVSPSKVTANNMPGLDTASNGNWHVQHAQDAIFTINGMNKEITSESNKLTEVIEGMEITLKSEGETVLTVASDTSKLKENIREAVDAINLVKKTILELSKVDEEKETTNPDDNKMSSQLTWQKGSALTGNYGVQLFLTEFNTINTSMGGGFRKKDAVDDIFGDTFTVLSEIGIKTNANAGDPNFGLLEIDEEKLDKALEEDMDAVVELFSAPLGGTTPSAEFTVASAGMHARPGNYEVKYDVNANGEAENVYINGVKAQTDPEFPGRWTVADPKNDAAGVAIQFPNGGMATGTGFTSEVRIRQGKINELSSFLDRELVQTTVTGVEQGKIPTIIAGLRANIKNIETKIDQETDRIALWEQRERLKFSRLEEVLTKYNSQMNSIASMASGMMPR